MKIDSRSNAQMFMFIEGISTSECKESGKIRAFYSHLRSDDTGMDERHKTRLNEEKEKKRGMIV